MDLFRSLGKLKKEPSTASHSINTMLLRETKQRQAIRRSIEESGRPLGPKEILTIAGGYAPNLGIAAVYRNLKILSEKGDLEPVRIPGQSTLYQERGAGDQSRFVCTRCSRVFNLNGKVRDEKAPLPNGYTVERREILFYGTRDECIRPGQCPYSL